MKYKYGVDTCYPDYYLWKYLKNPPVICEEIKGEIVRPVRWEYNSIDEMLLEHSIHQELEDVTIALNYFFQSYKWFEGYEDQVIESLTPDEFTSSSLLAQYGHWFTKPTIGLGIRLGDFKNHGTFFQIPHNWYIQTLDKFFPLWRERYNVIVFSDDINEAKEIFAAYPFLYTRFNDTASHREGFKYYHGDASEQFFLGTMMDNFILGNSTFSWWQGFHVGYKGGTVVHCGEVFSKKGNMKNVDIKDYYHTNWIKFPIK